MRALIISNMYPGANSYYGLFIKNQIDALNDIGVEVKAIVKRDRKLSSWIIFLLKTVWNVVFNKYDVIHAHYGFHSAIVPSIFKRKALIITFHGSDALLEPYRNLLYMKLQKLCIKKANKIIAVSRDIKQILVNKLEANESIISILPCGIDTKKFCPIDKVYARRKVGLDAHKNIVLYVGQLQYMKGVDIIYKCAEMMPDIQFVLIGEGEMLTELTNCKLVGAVDNKHIPLWINACDVFILPSRSEGTPIAVLEAISCNVPVICSDVGGCEDLIKDCKAGLILKLISLSNDKMYENTDDVNNAENCVLDAFQLKEKLNLIFSLSEKKSIDDRASRNLVVEKFDRIVVAKKIASIYKFASHKYS